MRTPSRADRVSSCWCDVRVGMYVEAGDGEDRIYDTLANESCGNSTRTGHAERRTTKTRTRLERVDFRMLH